MCLRSGSVYFSLHCADDTGYCTAQLTRRVHLAFRYIDGSLFIWQDGLGTKKIPSCPGDFAWPPDGGVLATNAGTVGSSSALYDTSTWQQMASISLPVGSCLHCMQLAWSPTCMLLVSSGRSKRMRLVCSIDFACGSDGPITSGSGHPIACKP